MELKLYTLNTGHMVESHVLEEDKELYFLMRKIINRAKKRKTELLDNTYIEIIEEPLGYVCTLYGKRGKDYLLILSTAGTKNPDGRFYIWNNMQDIARAEYKHSYNDEYIDQIAGEVPYIVDYLYLTSAYFLGVLDWTGSYAGCLGWMMLFPEEMRKIL